MDIIESTDHHEIQADQKLTLPPLSRISHPTITIWRPDEPRIPRVPEALRLHKRNGDAYCPKVVSFGPYHHGNPGLERCQSAKHHALKMFVEGSQDRCQNPDFYFQRVCDMVQDARRAYDFETTEKFNKEDFAEMLLLDACFLIYFMDIDDQQKSENDVQVMKNHLGRLTESLIKQDMYVVDNQIPYKVLKMLINLRYGTPAGELAVSKFLYLQRREHHISIWFQNRDQRIAEIHDHLMRHQPGTLFEAFYEIVVWDTNPQEAPHQLTYTKQQQQQEEEEEEAAAAKAGKKKPLRVYRSADELRSRGIRFRPTRDRSLGNIKFHPSVCYGKLELPSWCVNKHSRVFLLNMIAYELSPYNQHKSTVLNYVNFMKTIIDSAADVRVLRERKILYTILGDDEEVSALYRDLDTYGTADKESFKKVKRGIQKHYDNKVKTCMVKFFNIYFGTPWAVMGMLAGIAILALTITQTHFTIHPRN